ncbi:ATP-binding protein [Roseateles asaccharophilus]|uniref:histidine kinase n=1 Tax=Roseateles asaccharophilus TaxID=582607 RepID=A0ABU2AB41_9BURK|nr:ATP-binding protein [Roseateles asaccharophilus]MDR7333808.1 signal transduction histidine kinase [Roseateles asaccharophilus]
MYLKNRLRILLLLVLLPVAGVGVVGTWLLVEREIEAVQAGTWERTRALATAMDARLQASITALQVLATSPALAAGDPDAFRPEAQRVLDAGGESWRNLLVSDGGSGGLRLSVQTPGATVLSQPMHAQSVREAARTGRPAVSPVIRAEGRPRSFAVHVPAAAGGLVLSSVLEASVIDHLLAAQPLPGGWTVAVVDAQHQFVIRRPALPDGVGISDSLRRALDAPAHGWTQGRLKDGREIYRTVQRSALSGWAIAVAIPKDEVEQSLHHVRLLWLGFGVVLAGCLGLAWWLAKGVARPIAALAEAAPALGRGEALALPEPGPVAEVRQLYEALQQASARLRERDDHREAAEAALRAANQAKDEFLAMLGHELRNPLSSLSNASALLQQAAARPDVVPMVAGVLSRQVHQMTRLVDDLLEVGRVTAGKIRLLPEPLDLAEAVRAALATLQGNARMAAHRVETELQPVWVQADGARLEQIIANLMDNALKYTPAGGRIHITVRRDGADALLQVADDGQGMSAELVRSAFDLFVQGERAPSREAGGLGLGLTLAQRLAQLHGGSITAASAGAGQGSTFSVRLAAIETPPDSAGAPPPAGPAAQRLVLVVEDNADAGESLVALLELLGQRAEWVGTGEGGVQRATALQPDLVLVDVGLPDIDGHEVARRLRAQPATQALRLVALTGYGTPEDRQRALAAGFDDHLAKPIGLPELERLLGG